HLLNPHLAAADRPLEVVSAATRQAGELLKQLIELLRQAGMDENVWATVQRVRELLEYAALAAPLARQGNLSLCDAASARSRQFSAALKTIDERAAQLDTARQPNAAWRQKLPAADVQVALEQVQQWQGKFWAPLVPAWWRMRGVLRRAYDFSAHAVRPTWKQVLTALANEYAALANYDQAVREARAEFQLDRDPQAAAELAAAIGQQVRRLPNRLRRLHATLLDSPEAEHVVERILAAADTAQELSHSLQPILVDYDRLPLDRLAENLAQIGGSLRQVPQALAVLGELTNLAPAIGTALREFPLTLPQLEAAMAWHTWEEILLADRWLGHFDGRTRQRHVTQLESLYDRWLMANAAEVCERVKQRFLANVQISNLPASQLTPEKREFKRRHNQGRRTLEHEFGKTMRYRSIRELVDGESGLIVRDLKPVWLMSPLSVSDTLPLAIDFVDVVIFDEASQVPLEESVPSLFRGKQVIVVGDEMQLPPTDFFSAKQADDDEAVFVAAGGELMRYDLESDSFLSHAAKNLAATMLGWHYRSHSESLISFSNWAFYDGRLLTVPDRRLATAGRTGAPADSDRQLVGLEHLLGQPLSFHHLPKGVYEKGRNRDEAEYIAAMVADLVKQRSGLSIGVIAFSEAQQDEIESALKRLAEQDEEFQSLYEAELEREVDGQFLGLLVKNLENIQGDERDVIILSICYGRGSTGKMLMNFGPINRSGGEKRLNVAFSRAKRHMAVVSSIQHTEITNDYNEGPNCLKNYLRYAEAAARGDVDTVQRVLGTVVRWRPRDADGSATATDAIGRQLAAALQSAGYLVDIGVGQSHFRVDLAVRRPDDVEYRLGILVDTVASYEQTDSLERYMQRPRLLRAFGWPIAVV
ncbi:MAG TPA: AAA domain-containing protein, partial [Pirellulales bacterium]